MNGAARERAGGERSAMAPRTKQAWIRIPLRVLLVAIAVTVLWFVVNRLLCGLWAVRVHATGADEAGESGREFDGRLRIATYNIARGGGAGGVDWGPDREALVARLRAIGEMLRDQRVDVAVLNEVDLDVVTSSYVNQARTIARATGFPYCVEQCNYDLAAPLVRVRIGNALLSGYPVREARLLAFPPHDRWETLLAGHKNAVVAEIELSPGRRFHLLGTHLEHRSETTRVRQARRIEAFRRASDLPLVVAGDLNSTPPGFPTSQTSRAGENAMSILLGSADFRTRPMASPTASDFTFPAEEPVKVIDWVLVPRDWRIVSKQVVASDLSDHLPVVVEVELPTP